MPASYSWLKLYYEIIDDPKMGRLPDRLWRRVIECFLLAGRNDKGGDLQEISALAWALRADEKTLEAELIEISKSGIVAKRASVWNVVNFQKRQKAIEDRDRKSAERDRKRKGFSHEGVTSCDTEGEERRGEEDKEGELEIEGASAPPRSRSEEYAAILAIKKITGKRSIPQSLYEILCETIGSAPDEAKLKACWTAWVSRGYKADNYAWALEWYKNGIPTNGKAQTGTRKNGGVTDAHETILDELRRANNGD